MQYSEVTQGSRQLDFLSPIKGYAFHPDNRPFFYFPLYTGLDLAKEVVSRGQVYAEAPLMKNHLSIELSIFSAGRFSLGGRGGSWSGETRLGEWPTVRLVLLIVSLLV